jgi:nitroreductase
MIELNMTYQNEVITAIHNRRSVREFAQQCPTFDEIREVLEAGIWAPSGLNNQPWRFVVIKDEGTKEEISLLTHYSRTVKSAPILICVFMDEEASYDRIKDLMGIGACNQNILLAAHSLGLGTVWLGEILKNKEDVKSLLSAPEKWELVAVIALGYAVPKERSSNRKPLKDVTSMERYGEPFRKPDFKNEDQRAHKEKVF